MVRDWHWNSYLIMDIAHWLKSSAFVVFMKNWQLIRSGTPRFYSPFDYDRLGFLQVCDNKGDCVWRRVWTWILGAKGLVNVIEKIEIASGVK